MPWKNETENIISEPYTNPFFLIVRVCIFLLSFIYIFGQLYFNNFAIHSIITSITAFIAAILSGNNLIRRTYIKNIILVFCCIAITSILYDAYVYYSSTHIPGNYYGWSIHGVFIATLSIVALKSYKTPNKKVKRD